MAEHIVDTNLHELLNTVSDNSGSHCVSKSADDGMLFDSKHFSAFRCIAKSKFLIKRLDRMERYERRIHTLARKDIGSFNCVLQHNTACEYRTVASVTNDISLSYGKRSGIINRSSESGCTDVYRAFNFRCRFNTLVTLVGIGRNKHSHTRQDSHKRNVLDSLMAAAVFTQRNACMAETKLDIEFGVTDAIPDLVIIAACKNRECGAERDKSHRTHTGSNVNHVCFCNTTVIKPVGIRFLESVCHCCAGQVSIKHNDGIVYLELREVHDGIL